MVNLVSVCNIYRVEVLYRELTCFSIHTVIPSTFIRRSSLILGVVDFFKIRFELFYCITVLLQEKAALQILLLLKMQCMNYLRLVVFSSALTPMGSFWSPKAQKRKYLNLCRLVTHMVVMGNATT